MIKTFLAFLISLTALAVMAAPTWAASDPPLFSCQNPIGTVIAQYSSGTHGIPGSSQVYIGSDTVYHIDFSHVLQCFCPNNGGTGVQSNWWRYGQLTDEEVEFFIRRGWVFVPNGLPWGLADAAYLVKNETISCGSSNGGNGGGGSSDGGSSSGGSSGNGGSILGASDPGRSGRVLGAQVLAATGKQQEIALYAMLSILFASTAYYLARQ